MLTNGPQFIHLVTQDQGIAIDRTPDNQIFDIKTYTYTGFGFPLTFIDTPGIANSRDGVSETDILEKLAIYLQEM